LQQMPNDRAGLRVEPKSELSDSTGGQGGRQIVTEARREDCSDYRRQQRDRACDGKAVRGSPALSVYSATKAAVRSFARTWCLDLKERKIRVNAISPGIVPTPGYNTSLGMTQEQIDQYVQDSIGNIPLGRPGTTDEVARVGSFLASDESSYVNGVELFIDGGLAQI
jgi:NAD(P)-dependent dehydrogenase (short-subunit alcohol dehydrogenase family)